jgi:hypothetical protein
MSTFPLLFQSLVFTIASLTSSALVFSIQPLALKLLLPKFEASPHALNQATTVFSIFFLVGFSYPYLLVRWLSLRIQISVQLILMLVSLGCFGLVWFIGSEWEALDTPIVWLLSAGFPVAVCTGNPFLLMHWFGKSAHPLAPDPYFLFAASALGSLLAIIGYPLWIEPFLLLQSQIQWWLIGSQVMGLFTCVSAALVWYAEKTIDNRSAHEDRRPTLGNWLRWLIHAAVPLGLVQAGLTYFLTEISPVPALGWSTLALYFFTFVLAFARPNIPGATSYGIAFTFIGLGSLAFFTVLVLFLSWHDSADFFIYLWAPAWAGLLLLPCWFILAIQPVTATLAFLVFLVKPELPLWSSYVILMAAIYSTARMLHAGLARERPAPKYLLGFFLCLAFGALLFGVWTAWLIPLVFPQTVIEYPLILVLGCAVHPWLGVLRPLQQSPRIGGYPT